MSECVDVIIPTYNGMPLLAKAIGSVLDQTYQDWVLYVIDDGSSDNDQAEAYVKSLKDKRVNYIKRAHAGRSAARNYGIQHSSSAYIALLDADDSWQKSKLEKQLALAKQRPEAGLIYGLANLVDGQGRKTGELAYRKRGDLFQYLLSGNKVSGGASMVLVRREVFDKVGGFREDLSMAEDWELWLRIAREYKMDYVDETIADIRIDLINERSKFLDKAKGLDYALRVMIDEFKLSIFGRAQLASACLSQSASLYLDGGDRQAARRAIVRMFGYNPLAFLMISNRYRLVVLRLFFGNKLLRSLRHLRMGW